ncbi:MAG: hypothetical protein WBB68_00705, partial [Candidatus Moraniibacteriota bacterium]
RFLFREIGKVVPLGGIEGTALATAFGGVPQKAGKSGVKSVYVYSLYSQEYNSTEVLYWAHQRPRQKNSNS